MSSHHHRTMRNIAATTINMLTVMITNTVVIRFVMVIANISSIVAITIIISKSNALHCQIY